jgi:hypothetical protein
MPATIASEKGRSFFAWWVYGTLLLPIELIHSFCIYETKEMRAYRRLRTGDLGAGAVDGPDLRHHTTGSLNFDPSSERRAGREGRGLRGQ